MLKHTFILVAASLLAWMGAASWLAGAENGESVVVIYNARMPASQRVAEHYAGRRHVPAPQVIGIKLPMVETMTRAEYEVQLRKPLLLELEQRKLFRWGPEPVSADPTKGLGKGKRCVESKFRYAVLCFGVPLRIAADANWHDFEVEKLPAEMRRNEAAVDAELACLPLSERHYRLAGLLYNPFYATTNAATLHPTNGILMVARLDGPSEEIARGLVDKAIQAETNGLWGRAYFDARGLTNGNYLQGDEWIRGAAEITSRQGYETILDNQPSTFGAAFPMSQIALYAGWYDGNASGPFTRRQVEFMPGAFAYHLHSFSAATLRSDTSNWVGPFLAKGVTATMGSVFEPYLAGTPDLGIFFGRWVVQGFTFGEAAYAACGAVSWQTTIVGDPLYQPFGRKLQQLQADLEKRQSPLLAWSHLRIVDLNLATGIRENEMIGYLEQVPLTRQSAVLSEKLADLYAIIGKPASAVHAYEQVLKLQPTPQQEVRVSLTLGDRLTALDKPAEAIAIYEQMLKDVRDYADVSGVYRKLLALAERTGNTDAAQRYRDEIKRRSK